jgi:hypothetical protein
MAIRKKHSKSTRSASQKHASHKAPKSRRASGRRSSTGKVRSQMPEQGEPPIERESERKSIEEPRGEALPEE